MKCIKCDNEAMENEVLCAECAAKERNINNECIYTDYLLLHV